MPSIFLKCVNCRVVLSSNQAMSFTSVPLFLQGKRIGASGGKKICTYKYMYSPHMHMVFCCCVPQCFHWHTRNSQSLACSGLLTSGLGSTNPHIKPEPFVRFPPSKWSRLTPPSLQLIAVQQWFHEFICGRALSIVLPKAHLVNCTY